MAAMHAGHAVRLERIGEDIVLTITEDEVRYVISERAVHVLHAQCHAVLDKPFAEVVAIQKLDFRGGH
jgi:hypothetical protein